MLMVGTFNLISVYFAVLFVGLGVDFGHPVLRPLSRRAFRTPHLDTALLRHGRRPARADACGAATAAGFLSFLPTAFRA